MATDQTSAYQTLLDRDPVLQSLLSQARSAGIGAGGFDSRPQSTALRNQIGQRISQIAPGAMGQDYAVDFSTGRVSRKNLIGRNIAGIAEGALAGMGGYAALGALGGGGAAPGVFNAAGTSAGGHSLGGGLLAGSAGTGGGGSSLLSNPSFWTTIAGLGSGVTNAVLQSKANSRQLSAEERAAQLQADATQKALDLQREMFNRDLSLDQSRYNANSALDQGRYNREQAVDQQRYDVTRNDRSPYRAAGQGSVGALAFSLGVPGFEGGPLSHAPDPRLGQPYASSYGEIPQVPTQTIPTQGPLPTTQQAAPAANAQPEQMVTLQAPDGSTKQVPASQADFYVSRGARRV